MFKQSHPRYIKALDGTSLYVCTNFHPDNLNSEEVVMVLITAWSAIMPTGKTKFLTLSTRAISF